MPPIFDRHSFQKYKIPFKNEEKSFFFFSVIFYVFLAHSSVPLFFVYFSCNFGAEVLGKIQKSMVADLKWPPFYHHDMITT